MGEEECAVECAKWAKDLMGYCLCSTKDGISLSLGFLSVLSWGVAEIPQIITNFNSKSTDGLSFAFLFTWLLGDFFNLSGCLLEPATFGFLLLRLFTSGWLARVTLNVVMVFCYGIIVNGCLSNIARNAVKGGRAIFKTFTEQRRLPTQFYMAELYTVTTLTLTLQSVYYGYIYPRLRRQLRKNEKPVQNQSEATGQLDDDYSEETLTSDRYGQMPICSISQSSGTISSPIPLPLLPRSHSADHDSYYMSARSLSTSHTPTRSSFLAPMRGPTLEDVKDSVEAPLLGGFLPTGTVASPKTKNLCCVLSAVTFVLGTLNLTSSKVTRHGIVFELSKTKVARHENRKLLQVNKMMISEAGGHSTVGTYLGWAMAAIYMGGRVPQIWLNITRGHVDGLNPFMFIFALLGNTTYVASILVNSLDWSKIMPNMPWLVDAGGCALLDIFILLQFIYFYYWQSNRLSNIGRE